jgi:hypothetical protein
VLDLRLFADFVHDRQQHVRRDDDARLQVGELIRQFVLPIQRTAGTHNGTDLLNAVMRDDILRTVVHEERDRLALRYA